jgi:NHLM bacteriocin system ABC transporter peptidase/ATP-binding protein
MPARFRTTSILQNDAVECGAAALACVLAYHGRHVPLDQLRDECGVTRDGSNAAGIVAAARHHGLIAAGYRMEPAELDELPGPSVLFWEFNHFLTYEGRDAKRVFINDPATGRRTITPDELDAAFTGVALAFEPGPNFEPTPAPPGPARAMLWRLRQHRTEAIFAAVTGIVLAVPTVLAAGVVRSLFDVFPSVTNPPRSLAIAIIIIAILIRVFASAILRDVIARSATKSSVVSGGALFWRVLRLPLTFFQHRHPHEAATRIDTQSDASWRFAEHAIPAVAACVTGFVLSAMLFALVPAMGLASIVGALLAGLAIGLTGIKGDAGRAPLELARADAVAHSALRRFEIMKASAREADTFVRVQGWHVRAEAASQQDASERAGAMGVAAASPLFVFAAVVVAGAPLLLDGFISSGMLAAGLVLSAGISAAVNVLAPIPALASRLAHESRRQSEFTRQPGDQLFDDENPAITMTAATRRLKGFIELRNVTFGFNRLESPLLENLTLTVNPGEMIAIVGASGSGKSTLARLIAGLISPWSGEIFFDGAGRDRLPRTLLANSVAVVDQDVWLFNGTVRENITLWDSTVPDDAVQRAAKDAAIHDRITRRRGGYNAPVWDAGANFSGGQRQRLAIARALAMDPTVLILDEATSALDPGTEREVLDAVRRRGCTCILVAHRLSAVRDCRRVVVLDQGTITQQGRHEQLIEEDGPYARLMRDTEALAP